ncbi:hypothetical protein Mp_6g02200 [Marchantia polymorpha subsp. ruderalis]|uniref:Uncharacterized protein n=2 Tax=Marchantia polymorpha TaxID=3197 RepID=A0AAF6BMN4_MARPO|nr:hypothetical protein MARPO_0035s0008 [Marchantia polymorpha]BBN13268.1 hypothetical protein Mp_6g02200 [Marchantia polymorpha subsp. ruderalis]|eukprot:PTQ41196.1 hypothetical protein MARPO_0035s0008 [Marchantia polymorpha]
MCPNPDRLPRFRLTGLTPPGLQAAINSVRTPILPFYEHCCALWCPQASKKGRVWSFGQLALLEYQSRKF